MNKLTVEISRICCKASETIKECRRFLVFGNFLHYFFEGVPRLIKRLFHESESLICNCLFRFLAQKCSRAFVKFVFKFQLFFLNFSSKFLAGVRVRTSNILYGRLCRLKSDFWRGGKGGYQNTVFPWQGGKGKSITPLKKM